MQRGKLFNTAFLSLSYVHLLTISSDPALSLIGTLLRFPAWFLVIICLLSINVDKKQIQKAETRSARTYQVALLAFILWSALSLLWSADKVDTLIKVSNFALIFLTLRLAHSRRWSKNYETILYDLKSILLAATVYFIASGILTAPEAINSLSGGPRYQGVFHNPNTVGALSATLFFPSLFVSWSLKRRLVSWPTIIFIAGLILSGSRSSTIALIVAGCTVTLIRLIRQPRFLQKLIPAFLVAIFPLTAILIWILSRPAASVGDLIPRQLDFSVSSSLFNGREDLWQLGLKLFRENPFLGVGMNGSRTALQNLSANSIYRGEASQFHSSYIEIVIDLGLVGAILFALILLLISFQIFRQVNHIPLLCAGTISPLILAFTESALFGLSSIVASTFWILTFMIFSSPSTSIKVCEKSAQLLEQPSATTRTT